MKNLIMIGLFVLLAAGCASMQTEIIQDPGKIDTITVGHFTTANPVDDELIGSYLRKELSKRGFTVTDYSPYVLTGTIAVHPWYSAVEDARIVLKKDDVVDQIIWSFHTGWITDTPGRKDFARYLAEKIAKQLR